MKKVAINGFGRIGRAALKLIFETDDLEVVAILVMELLQGFDD